MSMNENLSKAKVKPAYSPEKLRVLNSLLAKMLLIRVVSAVHGSKISPNDLFYVVVVVVVPLPYCGMIS